MLQLDLTAAATAVNKRLVIGWAVASLLLAIGAPFGTNAIPLVHRLYYWPLMVAIALTYSTMLRTLLCPVPVQDGRPTREVFVGILFAIFFTPTIWLVTDAMLGLADVSWVHLKRLFPEILIVGIVVSVVRGYVSLFLESSDAVTPEDEGPKVLAPRLLDRIEGAQQAQIIRLTVNDHYVVVVLDNGRVERLLMRLRDAVEELYPLEGFFTHRSHWVNPAFIKSVHREGGKDLLAMSDGSIVPVSRTYRPMLVEAGIL